MARASSGAGVLTPPNRILAAINGFFGFAGGVACGTSGASTAGPVGAVCAESVSVVLAGLRSVSVEGAATTGAENLAAPVDCADAVAAVPAASTKVRTVAINRIFEIGPKLMSQTYFNLTRPQKEMSRFAFRQFPERHQEAPF